MSDTRFMPKQALRSTGINNTASNVPRVATGPASNMSASAGAPSDGQKVVRKARQLPETASQGRGGSRAAAPNRAQDARVTMIQSGATRIRSAGMAGVGPSVLPVPFNQDQLLLLGFLLDKYKHDALGDSDDKNAQLAQGALDVVGVLLQAVTGTPAPASAPAARAGAAGAPLGTPFKSPTGSSVVLMPAQPPRGAAAQAALAAKEAARAAKSGASPVTGSDEDENDEGPEAA